MIALCHKWIWVSGYGQPVHQMVVPHVVPLDRCDDLVKQLALLHLLSLVAV